MKNSVRYYADDLLGCKHRTDQLRIIKKVKFNYKSNDKMHLIQLYTHFKK